MIHWCRTVCGPVGNAGDSHQKGQQSFNSVKWLESQEAVLGGFIIHAGKYVRCIQFIGNQEKPESGRLTFGIFHSFFFFLKISWYPKCPGGGTPFKNDRGAHWKFCEKHVLKGTRMTTRVWFDWLGLNGYI